MTNHRRLTAPIIAMLLAIATVAFMPTSASAQDPVGAPDNLDVVASESIGFRQYRRQGARPIYGFPLNQEYYPYPNFGCLESGVIVNDMFCTLNWSWTNTGTGAITGYTPTVTSDGPQGIQVRPGFNNMTRIEPGETGALGIRLDFNPTPGFYQDTLRVTASNGEAFEVVLTFEVLGTHPSHVRNVGSVLTGGELSIYWSPPEFDGGSPITGYVVELVTPAPQVSSDPSTYHTSSNVWWSSRVEACNFRGRPELLICDMPNNLLNRIEAGTYRVAVQALTAFDGALRAHGDVTFTDEFAVPTLALPAPAPTPTIPPPTVPTPTPISVIVADYNDAPDLASLIAAANYSDKLDAPVLRLYQAFFNRTPDLSGAKYWLNIRRGGVPNGLGVTGGYTLTEIAGFMSGSAEYAANFSGNSDSQFLEAVYRNVLGRTFDQAGFEYWQGLLLSGQLSRVKVVFYVTQNAEFINNYPFTNN